MLNPSLLQKVEKALSPMVHFKAFTAAPYLVILCFVLILSLNELRKNPRTSGLIILSCALSASGLVYWLPYTVLGPADDFRYTSWSVFCAISSLLTLASWYIHHKRDLFANHV